jgi:sugar diacid utilization regulator
MAQILVGQIVKLGVRFGLRHVGGPASEIEAVAGVEIMPLEDLAGASPGKAVIAVPRGDTVPRPYQVDIAIRRASAARCALVVLVGAFELADTARSLAERGGLPVLMSGASPSDLAVFLDRTVRGGAAVSLSRVELAAQTAAEAAARAAIGCEGRTADEVLTAVSTALDEPFHLVEDPQVAWERPDAVCVGDVPIGYLAADSADASVGLAVPIVAAILSRALQREMHDRFGPTRSRADLIIELVFADSSRIDTFAAEAVRAGVPLHLSHAVAWLSPTHRTDPDRPPPSVLAAALELHALQLIEDRAEVWHLAVFRDDIVLVASEEIGSANHQRRLREVVEAVVAHAASLEDGAWALTAGLGTPRNGAAGLRQSATEARVAAEAAIAGGRAGTVAATDVSGLRRVLLDFYASPLSRALLDDVLAPLDALGADRARTAIVTLLAYLGRRGSLARAGEALNLHPNAVNYRIRRAEKALGMDLEDPDVRFAVELACRVRLLAPS